jgi:heat shock protein HslJ
LGVARRWLAAWLALAAAAGCGAGGGEGGPLEGTNWVLASQDVSGVPTPVPAGVSADARFVADQISGFGGCNVFSGEAVATGARLAIGAVAATQMACLGEGAAVEAAFLANLRRAASFTATADALTLFDAEARPVLVFRAGPSNPLAGNWSVTGIHNCQEAVVSPQLGTTVTASFEPDGRIMGSGGCNTYTGPYTLSGRDLRIGPLASTRRACEPAILDQETRFLAALGRVTTFDTSGPTVMLRDAGGAMQVVLAPE